jgi:SAM-dependent methyltransferase
VSPRIPSAQEAHWDGVYRERRSDSLSWFQKYPALSLELITAAAPNPDARIIDVGGGDSLLVDRLLEHGYRQLTVLDISRSAIERSQARLANRADTVRWMVGDVLNTETLGTFDVWHDRALFHFLLEPSQRERYVEAVKRAVMPRGAVVIATFAPDGPPRCSGLDVRRYDESSLAAELGEAFALVDTRRESHHTPSGGEQAFLYASFRTAGTAPPPAGRLRGRRLRPEDARQLD